MAAKEPKLRLNVQLGDDFAFAVRPAILGDMGDPIEHEHRR